MFCHISLVLILYGLKSTNQMYVNVALNKPAYLSSTDETSSDDHSANVGVDGVIAGMTYVMTKISSVPSLHWFVIDLLNKYEVDHVVVYNRRGDLNTISKFIVGLSNNFDADTNISIPIKNLHICGQYKYKGQPPEVPMIVNCTKVAVKWRFVVLKQSFMVRGSMGFSEVEVYALHENFSGLYIGCFSLLTNQTKSLNELQLKVVKVFTSHTISDCLAACSKHKSLYAFISRGDECSCGNVLNSLSISSAYCNFPCPIPNEKCGGQFATSVYSVRLSYEVLSFYQGCFEVLPDFRSIFPKSTISYNGVDAEECLKLCLTKNFQIAAIQIDRICYCGGGWEKLRMFKRANKEHCIRKCSKNADNHCGGESALSLYTGCFRNVLGLHCTNFSHCLHSLQPLHLSASGPENYEETAINKVSKTSNGIDKIINSDSWVFYTAAKNVKKKRKNKNSKPTNINSGLDFTQIHSKMCPKTKCQPGWKGYACHLRDCSIRNGNCGKFDCMEAQVNGVWMGECVCEKGYTRRHYLSLCVDIDECTLKLDLCSANHLCVNTHGSYVCEKMKGVERENFIDVWKENIERVNEDELSSDIDEKKRRSYHEKTKRNIKELIDRQIHMPSKEQKFFIKEIESDTIKNPNSRSNDFADFLVYVDKKKEKRKNKDDNLNKNQLSKRNLMDIHQRKVSETKEVEKFVDSPENIINLDFSYNADNDLRENNKKFTLKIDFEHFIRRGNKNHDDHRNKMQDYKYNLKKFKTKFKDRIRKIKKTKSAIEREQKDFYDMSETYNYLDTQEKDYNAKPVKPINDIYDNLIQINKNPDAMKHNGAKGKSLKDKSSILLQTSQVMQGIANMTLSHQSVLGEEESIKVKVLCSFLVLLLIILFITSTFLYKHFRKKTSNSNSEHTTFSNSEREEKMFTNFPNVAYSEVISTISPMKQQKQLKDSESLEDEKSNLEKSLKPKKSYQNFLKINKKQLAKEQKNGNIISMLTYVKEAEDKRKASSQEQKSNMLLVLPKAEKSSLKKVNLSFFKIDAPNELKPSNKNSFPEIWKTLYQVSPTSKMNS